MGWGASSSPVNGETLNCMKKRDRFWIELFFHENPYGDIWKNQEEDTTHLRLHKACSLVFPEFIDTFQHDHDEPFPKIDEKKGSAYVEGLKEQYSEEFYSHSIRASLYVVAFWNLCKKYNLTFRSG